MSSIRVLLEFIHVNEACVLVYSYYEQIPV
jgi:hypothetical protein